MAHLKIIALGASISKNSINKAFAHFVASTYFPGNEIKLLDLNAFYPSPVYSVDDENETGIPEAVKQFNGHLQWADLIVLSFAEHNGSYTAAFKNIFDWTSRLNRSMFQNKKMLLLATSPAKWGAATVLETALKRFSFLGAEIVGKFSLPAFSGNFHPNDGFLDKKIQDQFDVIIQPILSLK